MWLLYLYLHTITKESCHFRTCSPSYQTSCSLTIQQTSHPTDSNFCLQCPNLASTTRNIEFSSQKLTAGKGRQRSFTLQLIEQHIIRIVITLHLWRRNSTKIGNKRRKIIDPGNEQLCLLPDLCFPQAGRKLSYLRNEDSPSLKGQKFEVNRKRSDIHYGRIQRKQTLDWVQCLLIKVWYLEKEAT